MLKHRFTLAASPETKGVHCKKYLLLMRILSTIMFMWHRRTVRH